MLIQYQEGDRVCKKDGSVSGAVVSVHRRGVTICDIFGATHYLGKKQVVPCESAVRDSIWMEIVK